MRIGIYPRKSVYRDNSESVVTQVKLCKEYAEIIYRGQPLEYFVYDKDEGFSGKNTQRPGYQRLMQDVRSGLLDVVMVYKLDRISRNVQDFSNTFSVFQEHGVSFVSVKESFDTSTPIGRTVMYILAAFAQLERENTSERVSDSMLEMARSGFWTGGRCPAGMRSVRRSVGGKEHSFLEVDEAKIGQVKQLFDLYLSGMSITGLERYCRDHGIQTERGKYLSTSQLYFILSNPVYCQNSPEALAYFREKSYGLPDNADLLFDSQHGLIGYGRKAGTAAPYTIAIGAHDYVITGVNWVAVQRRMGVNKQVRTSKYECGLLKGVLRCKCGSRVITKIYNKKGVQYRFYLCAVRDRQGSAYCDTHHINMDRVDDLFMTRLKDMRIHKGLIELKDIQEYSAFDFTAASRRQKELNGKIENLMNVLEEADGQASSKYILRQIDRLDEEIRALDSRIQEARRQELALKNRANAVDQVYGEICQFLDHFEFLSYREKNEAIKKMVKECVFDDGTLKIVF